MATCNYNRTILQPYQELETAFGQFIGNENVVVCSSGTAALHLALEVLQLPLGSQFVVPEFTMVACARAVTLAGLEPVFVDCQDDLLIDPKKLSRVSRRTRGVMAVHIYGRQCNMQAIHREAALHNWTVIEDLAEAHGVQPHPQSDAACWSFYHNKIVSGEEGGAVAFKNAKHARMARKLRTLGFTEAHDFSHTPRGMNYRLANLLATPILKSLQQFNCNSAQRFLIEDWYNELVPSEWHMPQRQACWVYDLRIPGLTHEQQNEIISSLNEQGIAARHAFKPMSSQREYRNSWYHRLNATRLSREVFYLPVYPTMSRQDVSTVVDALLDVAVSLRLSLN